ncbi:hypothetical protein [Balneatrix alpica]|uniref:Uncharacterized protein n=1 Tax=Balneatrix alpica TaxID=75684 RepID=A0ABV5ZCQ4_9GAMM|nr:hypothetical protein [Balneatrix alpica]
MHIQVETPVHHALELGRRVKALHLESRLPKSERDYLSVLDRLERRYMISKCNEQLRLNALEMKAVEALDKSLAELAA